MSEKIGSCWFIHYSYEVNGKIHEASIFLNDLSHHYFRYNYLKDGIESWLSKTHEGDLSVVIRNYKKASPEEHDEWWGNKPEESWMIDDITK